MNRLLAAIFPWRFGVAQILPGLTVFFEAGHAAFAGREDLYRGALGVAAIGITYQASSGKAQLLGPRFCCLAMGLTLQKIKSPASQTGLGKIASGYATFQGRL